jgi:hypothetical protein
MEMPSELKAIEGAEKLYAWFGYWPSFHDAEVVSLHLNRRAPSSLIVHTWEMTNEVNKQGHYQSVKHVVVKFIIDGITALNISDFSIQNVIFGLSLEKKDSKFVLNLEPCYGLAGTLEAEDISILLNPGKPSDSRVSEQSSS